MHKFKTALSMGADKHTHVRLDRISAVKPDHNHSAVLVDGMWIGVEESEEEVLEVIEKWYEPTAGEVAEIAKTLEIIPVGVDGDRATAATGKLTPQDSRTFTKAPAKRPAKKSKKKLFGKNTS